jgi:hypothetical protein
LHVKLSIALNLRWKNQSVFFLGTLRYALTVIQSPGDDAKKKKTGPNGRSSLFGAANGARSHQEKPRRVRSPADGKPEAGGNGHLERCEKL